MPAQGDLWITVIPAPPIVMPAEAGIHRGVGAALRSPGLNSYEATRGVDTVCLRL